MNDIDRFLKEDLGNNGDITSDSLFTSENSKAKIIAKEEGIIAGIEDIKKIFNKLKVKTNFFLNDGDFVKKHDIIAEINGKATSILKGERLILNILGRMSGIATETKKLLIVFMTNFRTSAAEICNTNATEMQKSNPNLNTTTVSPDVQRSNS